MSPESLALSLRDFINSMYHFWVQKNNFDELFLLKQILSS